MKQNKKRNPFDLNIEPIQISKFRINPDLLDILAERRRNKKR